MEVMEGILRKGERGKDSKKEKEREKERERKRE